VGAAPARAAVDLAVGAALSGHGAERVPAEAGATDPSLPGAAEASAAKASAAEASPTDACAGDAATETGLASAADAGLSAWRRGAPRVADELVVDGVVAHQSVAGQQQGAEGEERQPGARQRRTHGEALSFAACEERASPASVRQPGAGDHLQAQRRGGEKILRNRSRGDQLT
jgi:hypothetical protein